jgi:hypothetical protein
MWGKINDEAYNLVDIISLKTLDEKTSIRQKLIQRKKYDGTKQVKHQREFLPLILECLYAFSTYPLNTFL